MEALYVSEKTENENAPSKEYGEAIAEIALQMFGTNDAVLKAAGHKGGHKNETLRRLKNGTGSHAFARRLERALKDRGADLSVLPPMYSDEKTENEDWRREWIWIGEILHQHAPGLFDQALNGQRGDDGLRTVARALARMAGQQFEISRANVSR